VSPFADCRSGLLKFIGLAESPDMPVGHTTFLWETP